MIDNDQPVSKYIKDVNNWQYVVSQLREDIFNSSSVTFPPPEAYMMKKAKMNQHTRIHVSSLSMMNNNPTYRYNSDPFISDAFMYRQLRSENLLIRMMRCSNLDWDQNSLMRLSKGVFLHQKSQSSLPQSSPTMSTIKEFSSCPLNQHVEAPITTFHQNDFQQNMYAPFTDACYDMFVPYSYTLGARFTNPYKGKDIMIRGKVPLWCQSLFISECLDKLSSIQPYVPYTGLFSFAPQMTVIFKPLISDHENLIEQYQISPEFLVAYEKFTLEDIDQFTLSHIDSQSQWLPHKKSILQNVLICDISDDMAKILDQMSTYWISHVMI
ncbi:hypothetical protein BDB01DRAFT_722745 [Pilobolus umbonatus]|nr:hypothetical protein BDB01DRAFT_722745 [Pilobolus umbonatus]